MGSIDKVKKSSTHKKATQMSTTTEAEQVICFQATQNYLPEQSLVTEFTVLHPLVYNAHVQEHASVTLQTL